MPPQVSWFRYQRSRYILFLPSAGSHPPHFFFSGLLPRSAFLVLFHPADTSRTPAARRDPLSPYGSTPAAFRHQAPFFPAVRPPHTPPAPDAQNIRRTFCRFRCHNSFPSQRQAFSCRKELFLLPAPKPSFVSSCPLRAL